MIMPPEGYSPDQESKVRELIRAMRANGETVTPASVEGAYRDAYGCPLLLTLLLGPLLEWLVPRILDEMFPDD